MKTYKYVVLSEKTTTHSVMQELAKVEYAQWNLENVITLNSYDNGNIYILKFSQGSDYYYPYTYSPAQEIQYIPEYPITCITNMTDGDNHGC